MYLNGFLLFFVTLTPFTTSLAADQSSRTTQTQQPSTQEVSFFSGSLGTCSGATHRREKADRQRHPAAEIKIFNRNFYVGPAVYSTAFLMALVSGTASVLMILAVAVFYGVGTRSTKRPEASN